MVDVKLAEGLVPFDLLTSVDSYCGIRTYKILSVRFCAEYDW